jgi:membrane protease YdiL (CAAX protease family)
MSTRSRTALPVGIVDAVAGVIVFNWVFNNARDSVLIIILMHAANNAVSGSLFSQMFPGLTQFASHGYSLWPGQSPPSW